MMPESAGQMADQSVLTHLLRRGEFPTGGGCLCAAGDCPHCLATIDGVAYTRTCQTPFREGMRIEAHPRGAQLPPLESRGDRAPVSARTIYCNVVVIGQGPAGRAAADEARMHKTKGLLWIAHSEAGVRQERARAEVNTAFGSKTEYVGPSEIRKICPELDMT